MCSLSGAPGAMELGTSQSHSCSLVLVPVGATRLPPPRSQTQPGATDCPQWVTRLQISSMSFFPQLEAPCPSVLMPVQVPVEHPVPQLELQPPQQVHPVSPPASWTAREAEPALHQPGPASPWRARRLGYLPQVPPKPSLGGAQPSSLRNAAPGACRANEKRMGPTSGSD